MKILDSVKDLWISIHKYLEENLAEAVMNTWINDLVPISFENYEKLVLETSSDFKKGMIEKKFIDNIKEACVNTLGFEADVTIVVKGTEAS